MKQRDTSKATTKTSRRKFLRAGAATAAGVAGAATLGFPMVYRSQTVTFKMQGALGAKDVFNDMAMQYVDSVNAMGGGRL